MAQDYGIGVLELWYKPRKFLPNWTVLYQSSLKGEVQNQRLPRRNKMILKNVKDACTLSSLRPQFLFKEKIR